VFGVQWVLSSLKPLTTMVWAQGHWVRLPPFSVTLCANVG